MCTNAVVVHLLFWSVGALHILSRWQKPASAELRSFGNVGALSVFCHIFCYWPSLASAGPRRPLSPPLMSAHLCRIFPSVSIAVEAQLNNNNMSSAVRTDHLAGRKRKPLRGAEKKEEDFVEPSACSVQKSSYFCTAFPPPIATQTISFLTIQPS